MQTRRDRLQAYQYLLRRIMAALLGNEPESPEQPMRRVKTAMFSGIMVGALACGGVAFYGFITHQGERGWMEDGNALIQVKENGQQFVWMKGVLRPVANYTSAKLLLGSDMKIREIPDVSLTDDSGAPVPRGTTIGILDVPGALPEADGIRNERWNVCNHVTRLGNQQRRLVDVIVNQTVSAPPVNPDDGLIVEVAGQDENDNFLIYNGKRLAVTDDVLRAMRFEDASGSSVTSGVTVLPAWINAVPAGQALEPITVPRAGAETGPQIQGNTTMVGQLFSIGDEQYYVMTSDGLVPLSEVQGRIYLNSGNAIDLTGIQGEPTEISPADVSGNVAANDTMFDVPDHPTEVPELMELEAGEDTSVCMHYVDAEPNQLSISVGAEIPTPSEVQPIGGVQTGILADRVTVPGGTIALIEAKGNAGADGTIYVVSDSGKKYPVPNHSLGQLGYSPSDAMPLPASIADLLLSGAALDKTKAGQAVSQSTELGSD